MLQVRITKTSQRKELNMSQNNTLFLECAAKLITYAHQEYPLPIAPSLEELTGKKYDFFDEEIDGVKPDLEYSVITETANRLLELGFLHAPRADHRGIIWNCGYCQVSFTLGEQAFNKLFGEIIDGQTLGDKITTAVKSGAKSEIPKLMSKGFVELCKLLPNAIS